MTTRPILTDPVSGDGLFTVPTRITREDEVRYAKRRQDSTRIAQYADSKCGLPNTYDEAGGYLCGGREDGSSSPCNKLVGTECLIRIKPINDKHHQSCGMWEVANAGDPEGRYSPKGKLDDPRIGFGGTKSDLGFSCGRCEYRAEMGIEDSEGRDDFCRLKGHPVEDSACCEDNEPVGDEDSDGDAMIKIKPSHKGLLHKKLGVKSGKKIGLKQLMSAKHSSSAAERKEATFAVNARKWGK